MLAMKLPEIEQRLDDVLKHGDLIHVSAGVIRSLIQQARFLAAQYNAVVTNPPYMGLRNMNPEIKGFLKDRDADLKERFVLSIHSRVLYALPWKRILCAHYYAVVDVSV